MNNNKSSLKACNKKKRKFITRLKDNKNEFEKERTRRGRKVDEWVQC